MSVPKCTSSHKAITMMTKRACYIKTVWDLSTLSVSWVHILLPYLDMHVDQWSIYLSIYCYYIILYYIYMWNWKMKSFYNEERKFFLLKVSLLNFGLCQILEKHVLVNILLCSSRFTQRFIKWSIHWYIAEKHIANFFAPSET